MASTVTAAPAGLTALPASAGKVSLGGAIRSEFTKIRSVRSTYWTLLTLIVVTVGIGALGSWGAASHWSQMGPADRASFDPTQQSLFGLILGQLIIAVLGALTITSEFSTGMVRTSLAVQPRRGTMVAAKGIVFTVVALVTGLVASFAAFFLGQALMSGKHINATISQPHVLSSIIGGGLFLTVCGMLAFGLGLLIRHTAGAISAAVVVLFVLFIMVNFLPQSWQDDIDRWLPFNAGSGVWRNQADVAANHLFAPWTGFAVFAGYAVIAIAAGLILFRKRNA